MLKVAVKLVKHLLIEMMGRGEQVVEHCPGNNVGQQRCRGTRRQLTPLDGSPNNGSRGQNVFGKALLHGTQQFGIPPRFQSHTQQEPAFGTKIDSRHLARKVEKVLTDRAAITQLQRERSGRQGIQEKLFFGGPAQIEGRFANAGPTGYSVIGEARPASFVIEFQHRSVDPIL